MVHVLTNHLMGGKSPGTNHMHHILTFITFNYIRIPHPSCRR